VRSFQEPTEQLRKQLLTPGFIWKSPPRFSELKSLLEKACGYLDSGRLLLVFDQFEEFLIIHERDEGRAEAREFIELLSSLQSKPISNLRVLLVLRSDYAPLLQPLNDARLLPFMHSGTNEMSISAFRERDAREFLEKSPLKIQPGLMDQIFKQMREIEPDAGLFRPITLNMMGLFLERKAVLEKREITSLRENFLEEHLQQCVNREDVREHAVAILKKMITRRGTNRAKSVSEIATETSLNENVISGCLLNLRDQGIVRCIDEREKVWETSHDFVAQLLKNIFSSRWRISTPLVFVLAPILPLIAVCYFVSVKPTDGNKSVEPTDASKSVVSHRVVGETVKIINGVKVGTDGFAFFWVSGMAVDADGSFHAFHPSGAPPGLENTYNAGRPGNWYGLITDNGTPSGNPVVQTASDPAPGFYVSRTDLQDENRPLIDPRRYVDSETVNYIAVPPGLDSKIGLGDFAVVIRTQTKTVILYAVVAEFGSPNEIGEGSIALANGLGIPSDPKTGGISDGIVFVVFPGSRKGWPLAGQEIVSNAKRLFDKWGGTSKAASVFPDLIW